MFYNYSWTYVKNLIHINTSHKNLHFTIIFSKRNYDFIILLKRLSFINKFLIIKSNGRIYLKIYPFYFKTQQVGKSFNIVTQPSRRVFISFRALRLVNKRIGNSLIILSTTRGLITHREALKHRIGGSVVGILSV